MIQSGLATRFSNVIARFGTSNLLIALLIAMTGCMLLGMALPTVAAYLVSNILFVPVLINLHIAPLPANMFVFYFGIMAQITPPVCLASYTAAGIAGADSMRTGITGMLYALVAFLVPYVFIYNPAILLMGSLSEVIEASAWLFFGSYLLAGSVAGFLIVPMNYFFRLLLFVAALCLITPETLSSIVGAAIGLAVIVWAMILKRRGR